ncbi:ATP-dependent RNA helicase vasa isoform X2 [Colletes gigas]|uniref:ATP-dependent RNA helicase vasa isoform X2 n=1 Tax=Colletes gigas TaxID=935657 RepID=UPI001C9B47A7|nr:ATP-dependent RNA helicase vasa isoform X2 [Colletes gigas]
MDDWGEDTYQQSANVPDFAEGGRSYGKGRGFVIRNNNDNEWDARKQDFNGKNTHNDENNDDNNWQSNDNYNDNDFGRSGRGGGKSYSNGGGRGSYRGRGGNQRGGFRNRGGENDDENRGGYRNRSGENGDESRGHRRNDNYNDGDRDDNRGKPRGKFGGRGDDNEDGEDQKPREIYIPPELPTDEQSLFENGVEMGINFDKYDRIDVKVSGENEPMPVESFETAGLRTIVLENIKKSGYTKPTPVQKHALPIIMGGRDLMACAQTGSGKTAAFAVPIINSLLENPTDLIVGAQHCEPQVLIVSPTRELTIQIWQQIVKFSLNSIIKTVVAYGGTSVMHQRGKLSAGCHILVATPGRLLDFLDKGRITFSSIRFLVLDEADRMLDMGFLPNIERIVDHETMVPLGERQTLMFSATFPDEVQLLAKRFLNNYLFLAVGIVGGACSDVEQNFYEVARNKKKEKLTEVLEREHDSGTLKGTLVFVEMKRKADFIAAFLSENNYPTTSIHGDRLQRQREEALADFKSGKMSILVATAVAARGLDIKNVSHVINYDLPKGIDEYVHRIGRTGRVGNRGRATSFFDPDDDGPLKSDLVRILKQAGQSVPDWLISGNASRNFMPGKGKRFGGEDIRDFQPEGEPYPEEACTPSMPVEPEEEW